MGTQWISSTSAGKNAHPEKDINEGCPIGEAGMGDLYGAMEDEEKMIAGLTSLPKPVAPFYCSRATQFHTQATYNLLAACRTFWLTREPHNLRNRR